MIPKLDTAEKVLTWIDSHCVSYEPDVETVAYIAACVRLRQAFDREWEALQPYHLDEWEYAPWKRLHEAMNGDR